MMQLWGTRFCLNLKYWVWEVGLFETKTKIFWSLNRDNQIKHAFNLPNEQYIHPYPSTEQSGASISVPMWNIHAHLRIKAAVDSVKEGPIKLCRVAKNSVPKLYSSEWGHIASHQLPKSLKCASSSHRSQSIATLPFSPKRSCAKQLTDTSAAYCPVGVLRNLQMENMAELNRGARRSISLMLGQTHIIGDYKR